MSKCHPSIPLIVIGIFFSFFWNLPLRERWMQQGWKVYINSTKYVNTNFEQNPGHCCSSIWKHQICEKLLYCTHSCQRRCQWIFKCVFTTHKSDDYSILFDITLCSNILACFSYSLGEEWIEFLQVFCPLIPHFAKKIWDTISASPTNRRIDVMFNYLLQH